MWSRRLMMPPEFGEPAGAKPLPPGLEEAKPPGTPGGMMGFLEGLFGGAPDAPAVPPVSPGPMSPNPPAGIFPETAGVPELVPAPTPQGAETSPPAQRRGRPRGRGRIRGRSGAKAIESMSQDEVLDLIYGDSPLTQSEINRLDARLNQLGVGKLEP